MDNLLFGINAGSATNSQEVCVNSHENWSVPVENQYLCFYDSAWVVNNYSLNNVSWFNPINNLLSSNDSVLIYNSQNTTYDYNYSDFCNSISFDQNFDLFVSTPVLSEDVMPGVVVLSTGAWFDPNYRLKTEVHGNPNVLTKDIGTSSLGQGPTSHTALIEIKKANNEEIADITIFNSLNI